jgi:GT2 family glycosyltransferase
MTSTVDLGMREEAAMDESFRNPLLSIVIPYFRGFDELSICLSSLKENLADLSYEVIVVENGSGDDSASLIRAQFPWVTLIVNSENRYFAAAVNQGAREAGGRYLLVLNSDTEIVGDVLQKMIVFMENAGNKHVGVCTCRIFLPDGNLELMDRQACGVGTFIIRFTLLEKYVLRKYIPGLFERMRRQVYYAALDHEPELRDVLSGQALLFRRYVFQELKGFDERYRLWFTDDELCHRMQEAGYGLASLPYEKILHRSSSSIKRLTEAQRIIDADMALYLRDRFGWPGFIVCQACLRADRALRRIVASFRAAFSAASRTAKKS